MIVDQNEKQLAPCIVAKVRHALGLTGKQPTNNKRCSPQYWERTCRVVGRGLPQAKITRAIVLYGRYIP